MTGAPQDHTIYPSSWSFDKKSVRKNDPAEKLMRDHPNWTPYELGGSGHRSWRWTDDQGTLHTVGCGSGTHDTNDAFNDARFLRRRVNKCERGGCDHAPAGLVDESHLSEQPGTPLFRVGQKVLLNGQPTWITEMDGNLVTTMDAAGVDDVVPTSELKAASSQSSVEVNEEEGPSLSHSQKVMDEHYDKIKILKTRNFVANRDGDEVGRASVFLIQKDGEDEPKPFFDYVNVSPKHRSQGIGRKLVEAVEDRYGREGYTGNYTESGERLKSPGTPFKVLPPKSSNILDKIHPTLDYRVWDDQGSDRPKLRPEHKKWIEETVRDILDKHGYHDSDKWLSLVITGSLTTYQYSDDSDVDTSLFVDAKVFPEWSRAEMIGIMVSNMDGTKLPGTPFPMQCFVVPPGITREELYKPGLRSGYEIETDKWIVPPESSRNKDVGDELNGFYTFALEQADKMERLLKYEPEKAKLFWKQIHTRRQKDQRAGKGDYTESNIIYKFLANRNLFPAISEATGEHIAGRSVLDTDEWRLGSRKVAAPTKQTSKFVYDPVSNAIGVGPLARIEGESLTHHQIAQKFDNIDPSQSSYGHVDDQGRVDTYGRPRIKGFGEGDMTPYELDHRTKQALQHAYPGTDLRWMSEPFSPGHNKWDISGPPSVNYVDGQSPVINSSGQEVEPKEEWSLG